MDKLNINHRLKINMKTAFKWICINFTLISIINLIMYSLMSVKVIEIKLLWHTLAMISTCSIAFSILWDNATPISKKVYKIKAIAQYILFMGVLLIFKFISNGYKITLYNVLGNLIFPSIIYFALYFAYKFYYKKQGEALNRQLNRRNREKES